MCSCSDENGGQSCGCCGHYNNFRMCIICFPYYDDACMIAAQFFSIVAFLISWHWSIHLSFVCGTCFVLLQVVWYSCQNKIGLYISAGISTAAAVTISWARLPYDSYCSEDDNILAVSCNTAIVVAFITINLWYATTGCIIYFVKSGRHTKWEEKLQVGDTTSTTTTTATIQSMKNYKLVILLLLLLLPMITVAIALAFAATLNVLLEIPNKIDDV